MLRRKYRERRNSAWERNWLQRELEASGTFLDERRIRRPALPPSATKIVPFDLIPVRGTVTPKRRRGAKPQEHTAFN